MTGPALTATNIAPGEAPPPVPPARSEFPAWLDRFDPDMPHRKAAFSAMYREFLFADEVYFIATAILWGDVRDEDAKRLERIFARILLLVHAVRWDQHPLCPPFHRGVARDVALGRSE